MEAFAIQETALNPPDSYGCRYSFSNPSCFFLIFYTRGGGGTQFDKILSISVLAEELFRFTR